MQRVDFFGNCNIISHRMMEARKKEKITQEQLAARLQTLGVMLDQRQVSRIELNERTASDYEVIGIARALKVKVDWLLGDFDRLSKSGETAELE